ncbi:MAG: hypothetical protein MUF69_03835 [Desulfobacterota bacterium]|nr:hypothetical protein [Thermodesulfobacteriota bacterium]
MFLGTGRCGGEARWSGADFFRDYLSPCIVLVWILFWAASGTLQAQSAEELAVLGRIPTDRVIDQIALAPGSRIAYGLSHLAGALYVFDLENYQVRKKIDLGRPPVGLAVDPGNGLAYVIAGSESRFGTGGLLWTINPEGLIQNSIMLTETPQDLALNSETDRLIVSAEKERKLLIFSRATLEKINEVPLPFGPRALALDPDSGRAVVTVGETLGGGDTDRVVVLDLETGTILAETDLAGGVTGVAVAGEKDLALLLSGDKLYLFDINQALPPSLLPEGPAPYKKVVAKNSRLRGNKYFGLEVNEATQRGIVSGQGGLVLVDLETRTLRRFSRTDIGEIRAVAVDPLRNTLWGYYWGPGASRRVEKGLMEMQLPNPRPELSALTPAEVLRGGANPSVAVIGRGFLLHSELFLGDQPLPGLFQDHHHLHLPLPPEAIARAGLLSLSVVNPAPEGGRSNSLGLLVKNPVPALTGLDPVAVPAGHAGLTLEVFGSGFQDDTSLLWDGLARPGSLVNAERIQVALTAADLETAALRTVAVSNPGPGGGQSNTILFSIHNPEPLLFRLSPQAASAGGPGFTLELTGSGLVRTSQVWFDHHPLETAYVDGGRLTALIPETLLQTPGLFPIRVVNPGPGGGSSAAIDFLVSAVALLPDGSFGKKYEDLVPADAELPAYDPWRFSLITGLVKEGSGNGLAGVEVTILGRPEYGTAQSDSDGRFSLPADGGETFVIRLRKAGFLEAQRQVAAGWNTVDAIENVVLIPQDLTATTLHFDGNPTTFSTHTGTMVSDERGERSLTLVFSGDNRAVVRDDQGLEQPLESFTVRATEYPGPEAMPARLPPNSAFTYCAELAVDGAAQVYFDKPVTVWVDNFLGFDVGEIVPVGYYDRERGLWVPGENGRVVRLLDTNEDGVVDAYEDGGGSFPAPGLTDRSRFVPNSTFWRLEVNHFTPWDCNWPYGPPPGAIAPNPAGPPVITRADPDRELTCINSYVEDRGGVFHEDLPLPGTDFFLHYASDRTPGYKPRITIPASGAAVPAELLRILVRMELAGRTFEAVLPAQANQQTEFIWDGLDHLGREVTGSAQARIRIGFEYPTVYYSGSSIYGQAFAQPGTSATWVAARENIIAWQESRLTIDRGAGDLARGWTLSVHQRLQPSDPGTLHKGDGTTLRNNVRLITTVAAARPVGDGTSALRGIALDRAGTIFFTDPYNYRYMRAVPGGEITYYSTFDTPLGIYRAYGLAMDGAGNLYLACPDAYAGGFIVKIDPSGGQAIIAGNRQKGFSGDDGPATAASLNWPEDLALDASGNIYIADTQNNRIRKIDPRGIITTVAGSGVRGFGGDGGPALEARMAAPRGVVVDPQGNLYIADTDNHRIRKVDAAGRINTLAGSGTWGFGGDGGPAAEALLYGPMGLALDGAGQLYLADQFNNRIRKVDSGGIISTVAGNGDQGNDNDEGGPAVQATVHLPSGVALDSAGNVYGVVSDYGKVKRIAFPGAFQAQGLTGDTVFAEANGQGYVLDSAGIHRTTYDLPTGKTLLTFDYDQAHQLTSVTDRFGNRTTIQRDGSGRPLSLTAPDGQVTRLTVDGDRHLTGLVYPDGSVYAFTYTPEGLLTAKTDPRGRPFTNQ